MIHVYCLKVEAVDKTGLVLPVSMWVKRLEPSTEPVCLVVMEPVERTVAELHFDQKVWLEKFFIYFLTILSENLSVFIAERFGIYSFQNFG